MLSGLEANKRTSWKKFPSSRSPNFCDSSCGELIHVAGVPVTGNSVRRAVLSTWAPGLLILRTSCVDRAAPLTPYGFPLEATSLQDPPLLVKHYHRNTSRDFCQFD